MTHIRITNAVVRYPLYSSSRQRSLLTFAAHKASFGRVARDAGDITVVQALNGVTIQINEGDRLALFGRNGSGKTTFLKMCAGLIFPDEGSVSVEGSHAAIINTGAGLDAEKTGAENVDYIGRLLGVPRHKRAALLEEVAEFTELGDFMYLPVRTYSAGMMVRLLFALATSIERDIIIADEVLGAGDALFVEKAAARVRSMFDRAKLLVIATHSGEIAMRLCNRALWMDGGRVVMQGDPAEVWDAYIHQRVPLDDVA